MSERQVRSAEEVREEWRELPMRVGLGQIKKLTDEHLQFAKQMGIKDILISPYDPHDELELTLSKHEVWDTEDLLDVRARIEDAGLRLFGLETMPYNVYETLVAEVPKEKIEVIKQTIRNMGEAGIPAQGYSGHPPTGVGRTHTEEVRGGAEATAFDPAQVDIPDYDGHREFTEEYLWGVYEEFLEEVVPVAEEADVQIGLHPTDPPVEEMAGVPLLFRNRENHKRAMELANSDHHYIKLGAGCWSEMGEDLPDVIRDIGGDNILYVHFRDVVGNVHEDGGFYETFVDDEASNQNEYEVMKALKETGFSGVMTPDHVPEIPGGDVIWGSGGDRGRAFTIGYLRGTLNAIEQED